MSVKFLYLHPIRKFEKHLQYLFIALQQRKTCFLQSVKFESAKESIITQRTSTEKDILEFQPIRKFKNNFTFNQSENSKIDLQQCYLLHFGRDISKIDIFESQPIRKFENNFTFNQSENSKITLIIALQQRRVFLSLNLSENSK